MKSSILYFVFTLYFLPVVQSQNPGKLANQMAKELCTAMDKYDENDPATGLEAAEDMIKIAENKDYETVNEDELMEAMNNICPEGAKKFLKLVEAGEEE